MSAPPPPRETLLWEGLGDPFARGHDKRGEPVALLLLRLWNALGCQAKRSDNLWAVIRSGVTCAGLQPKIPNPFIRKPISRKNISLKTHFPNTRFPGNQFPEICFL